MTLQPWTGNLFNMATVVWWEIIALKVDVLERGEKMGRCKDLSNNWDSFSSRCVLPVGIQPKVALGRQNSGEPATGSQAITVKGGG